MHAASEFHRFKLRRGHRATGCAAKFLDLICRPVAAQFLADKLIALFELELSEKGFVVTAEKHYRLVPPEEISKEELLAYSRRQG